MSCKPQNFHLRLPLLAPYMKNLFSIAFILLIAAFSLCAQPNQGEYFYKQALDKAQKGQLEQALALFDSSIAAKSDEYLAWYNRGVVKGMMGWYEDELKDMEQSIRLNPGYKKAYLNRGTARRHLTDYSGAIEDFTLASQLDSAYAEAFYDRGAVYELYGKMDLACADFERAKNLGFEKAGLKVEHCHDAEYQRRPIHSILFLTETADNMKYGFNSDYPVKVGTGPDGGLENEHAYLDLLRDAKGQPVRYQHVNSCCAYASAYAPHGLAMVDRYEIQFTTAEGDQRSVDVYLSFYDYDAPMVLHGFKVAKP